MFEIYKLNSNAKNPIFEAKKAQIIHLFNLAMDREDGCFLNGKPFYESPRVFDYKIKNNFEHTVTIETINEKDYFKSGDLINYQGYTWICSSSYIFHDLYCKGKLCRCNYVLRWQNDNKDIVDTPCFIQTPGQSSSGVDENRILRIGNDQLFVIVPCNDETLALRRDKRFFIDKYKVNPTPYEITRVVSVPYSDWDDGCLGLVCSEDQYNSDTDNIELMICDYKENKQKSEMFIIKCTSPQIRCGGNSKTFTAEIDSTVTWDLNTLDIQKDYIILTDIGNNQCRIKCLSNNNLIGSSFKLIANTEIGYQELLIDIIGGV